MEESSNLQKCRLFKIDHIAGKCRRLPSRPVARGKSGHARLCAKTRNAAGTPNGPAGVPSTGRFSRIRGLSSDASTARHAAKILSWSGLAPDRSGRQSKCEIVWRGATSALRPGRGVAPPAPAPQCRQEAFNARRDIGVMAKPDHKRGTRQGGHLLETLRNGMGAHRQIDPLSPTLILHVRRRCRRLGGSARFCRGGRQLAGGSAGGCGRRSGRFCLGRAPAGLRSSTGDRSRQARAWHRP